MLGIAYQSLYEMWERRDLKKMGLKLNVTRFYNEYKELTGEAPEFAKAIHKPSEKVIIQIETSRKDVWTFEVRPRTEKDDEYC